MIPPIPKENLRRALVLLLAAALALPPGSASAGPEHSRRTLRQLNAGVEDSSVAKDLARALTASSGVEADPYLLEIQPTDNFEPSPTVLTALNRTKPEVTLAYKTYISLLKKNKGIPPTRQELTNALPTNSFTKPSGLDDAISRIRQRVSAIESIQVVPMLLAPAVASSEAKEWLAAYLCWQASGVPGYDSGAVPVPLGWDNRKLKGFAQIYQRFLERSTRHAPSLAFVLQSIDRISSERPAVQAKSRSRPPAPSELERHGRMSARGHTRSERYKFSARYTTRGTAITPGMLQDLEEVWSKAIQNVNHRDVVLWDRIWKERGFPNRGDIALGLSKRWGKEVSRDQVKRMFKNVRSLADVPAGECYLPTQVASGTDDRAPARLQLWIEFYNQKHQRHPIHYSADALAHAYTDAVYLLRIRPNRPRLELFLSDIELTEEELKSQIEALNTLFTFVGPPAGGIPPINIPWPPEEAAQSGVEAQDPGVSSSLQETLIHDAVSRRVREILGPAIKKKSLIELQSSDRGTRTHLFLIDTGTDRLNEALGLAYVGRADPNPQSDATPQITLQLLLHGKIRGVRGLAGDSRIDRAAAQFAGRVRSRFESDEFSSRPVVPTSRNSPRKLYEREAERRASRILDQLLHPPSDGEAEELGGLEAAVSAMILTGEEDYRRIREFIRTELAARRKVAVWYTESKNNRPQVRYVNGPGRFGVTVNPLPGSPDPETTRVLYADITHVIPVGHYRKLIDQAAAEDREFDLKVHFLARHSKIGEPDRDFIQVGTVYGMSIEESPIGIPRIVCYQTPEDIGASQAYVESGYRNQELLERGRSFLIPLSNVMEIELETRDVLDDARELFAVERPRTLPGPVWMAGLEGISRRSFLRVAGGLLGAVSLGWAGRSAGGRMGTELSRAAPTEPPVELRIAWRMPATDLQPADAFLNIEPAQPGDADSHALISSKRYPIQWEMTKLILPERTVRPDRWFMQPGGGIQLQPGGRIERRPDGQANKWVLQVQPAGGSNETVLRFRLFFPPDGRAPDSRLYDELNVGFETSTNVRDLQARLISLDQPDARPRQPLQMVPVNFTGEKSGRVWDAQLPERAPLAAWEDFGRFELEAVVAHDGNPFALEVGPASVLRTTRYAEAQRRWDLERRQGEGLGTMLGIAAGATLGDAVARWSSPSAAGVEERRSDEVLKQDLKGEPSARGVPGDAAVGDPHKSVTPESPRRGQILHTPAKSFPSATPSRLQPTNDQRSGQVQRQSYHDQVLAEIGRELGGKKTIVSRGLENTSSLSARGVPAASGIANRRSRQSDPTAEQTRQLHRGPTSQLPLTHLPSSLTLEQQSEYHQHDVRADADDKNRRPEILPQNVTQDQSAEHAVARIQGDLQQRVPLLGGQQPHSTALKRSLPESDKVLGRTEQNLPANKAIIINANIQQNSNYVNPAAGAEATGGSPQETRGEETALQLAEEIDREVRIRPYGMAETLATPDTSIVIQGDLVNADAGKAQVRYAPILHPNRKVSRDTGVILNGSDCYFRDLWIARRARELFDAAGVPVKIEIREVNTPLWTGDFFVRVIGPRGKVWNFSATPGMSTLGEPFPEEAISVIPEEKWSRKDINDPVVLDAPPDIRRNQAAVFPMTWISVDKNHAVRIMAGILPGDGRPGTKGVDSPIQLLGLDRPVRFVYNASLVQIRPAAVLYQRQATLSVPKPWLGTVLDSLQPDWRDRILQTLPEHFPPVPADPLQPFVRITPSQEGEGVTHPAVLPAGGLYDRLHQEFEANQRILFDLVNAVQVWPSLWNPPELAAGAEADEAQFGGKPSGVRKEGSESEKELNAAGGYDDALGSGQSPKAIQSGRKRTGQSKDPTFQPPFSGAKAMARPTHETTHTQNNAWYRNDSFQNRSPATAPANNILPKSASVLDATERWPSRNNGFTISANIGHNKHFVNPAAGGEEDLTYQPLGEGILGELLELRQRIFIPAVSSMVALDTSRLRRSQLRAQIKFLRFLRRENSTGPSRPFREGDIVAAVVARDRQGKLAGYAFAGLLVNPATKQPYAEIKEIAVEPSLQGRGQEEKGQGVGGTLFRKLLEDIPRRFSVPFVRVVDRSPDKYTGNIARRLGFRELEFNEYQLDLQPAAGVEASNQNFFYISKTIGDFLRWRREEAGYVQREIAKKLKISAPTLSRIETDQHVPTQENAVALGGILGFDGDRFYQDVVCFENDPRLGQKLEKFIRRELAPTKPKNLTSAEMATVTASLAILKSAGDLAGNSAGREVIRLVMENIRRACAAVSLRDAGNFIRQRRKEKGWDQPRLHWATGWSVATISRIEEGKVPLNLYQSLALGKALGFNGNSFFKSIAPVIEGAVVVQPLGVWRERRGRGQPLVIADRPLLKGVSAALKELSSVAGGSQSVKKILHPAIQTLERAIQKIGKPPHSGLEERIEEQLRRSEVLARGARVLVVDAALLQGGMEEFVARAHFGPMVVYGAGESDRLKILAERNSQVTLVAGAGVEEIALPLLAMPEAETIGVLSGTEETALRLARVLPPSMTVIPIQPAGGLEVILAFFLPQEVLDSMDATGLEADLNRLSAA